MNLATIRRCLPLVSMAFLGLAHAGTVGTWYQIDEVDGDFTLTYKSKTYDLSVSPATYLVDDEQWFYNANLTPQSPGAINTAVENQYGLLAGSLTTVAYCDKSSCSGASVSSGHAADGTPTSKFTANQAFDYLAIHLGNGELFFHWSVPTDFFMMSGLPTSSISNYRAFLGPQVLATPIPAAALLFASGLGALGLIGRRRTRVHDATAV